MSPVQVVQAFYDALARSEIEAVLALLDPDLEWTEAERFPYFGGTWRSQTPSMKDGQRG